MLKKIFLIISAVSFCLLLISQMLSINVNAIQMPLSVREVTGEECEKILNNMQFTVVHSETEIEFFPIVCFDVRDDGLVAIGAKKHLTNEGIICVYKDGIFQYGYSFNVGSKFDIRWSNELINIRTDRSSLVLSINREGQVVRVLEDLQGQVNFDQRKKVVNGEMYFMQNNFENELFNVMGFIGSSYAQFCVTNAAGETTVLYDVSDRMLLRMTIAVIAFGSFFVIAILNLIIQGVRRRKKEKRFGY